MRLPHHLLRHPSGMWHFRLVVPKDLRPTFGRLVIKRSLRTRDPLVAREWAYVLSARYSQTFAEARQGAGMAGDDRYRDLGRFELTHGPEGLRVKTDGTAEDNAAALKAIGLVVGREGPGFPSGPHLQHLVQQGHNELTRRTKSTAPTLGEAIRIYTETEASNLKPNTWEQRRRGCALFEKAIGGDVRVDEITRPMASQWATGLLRSGLTKRYVANTVSHVAQIFEAQIQAGHLAKGENPVKGVVVLKASEKKALRASGHAWESFELPALKKIFDPQNLKRTRHIHVRWAVLIGLYTGARVSEVAQVFLRDFEELDGVKCMRLTNDSDGQSLKTEASKRLVPLHPDLLALGLWERVEKLRAEGAQRLFPDIRIDGKAGAGNSISKGFSYYLSVLGIKPRREAGIVGFHSLRKNVIQALQGSDLPAERRRALVGHEAGEDVHAGDYMRAWSATELSSFFPGLRWADWLNFDGLKELLN